MTRTRISFAARCISGAVLAIGGLLLGAQPASAVDNCIQDVWQAHGNKQGLTCTANDVNLSQATNINVISGGSCDMTGCRCYSGQMVTFTADFQMDLTADTRYDIGFYIATDGDPNMNGALTGQCSATPSLISNDPLVGNFINLDPSPDVCGDITGPAGTVHNPIYATAQITTQCPTSAGQQLELPFCTTWRQPGSNEVCYGIGNGTSTNDVYPGSPSKCNCGTLAIDIYSETPDITVTKDTSTMSVPETGGSAAYSVKIENDGALAVNVTSITDNKYGDITQTHEANEHCDGSATMGVCQAVTATTCVPDMVDSTCEVGGSIAGGGECSCTFTGTVPPGDYPGNYVDTVTGCANNITTPTPICKTDDATVPYSDVPQPPTLVKKAISNQCTVDTTYTVVVTNTSAQDTLTLNSLTDDKYGVITATHAANSNCDGIMSGICGEVVSTTCGQADGGGVIPTVPPIAAGGVYGCQFVGRINSCSTTLTDKVTGSAQDDDGATYDGTTTPPFTDTATVVISVTTP